MTASRLLPSVAILLVCAACLPAQQFDPPASKKLDEATRKAIAAKMEKLEKALAELRKPPIKPAKLEKLPFEDRRERNRYESALADVEIYRKAVAWILRHGEFYDKDSAAWILETLDRGLERAEQMKKGQTSWVRQPGRTVVRGYRSRVDDSFQPYAITLPVDYGKGARNYRVDVVLHGRDSSLTEVKFIHRHHDNPAPKQQDYIRIDVYGRGNVAYRWAGEADCHEALSSLWKRYYLDPKDPSGPNAARQVLRGFSMGGAGTWHIGLHGPSSWCVIGPGAGFTTTHGYIKGLPQKLPPYQEKCLHIYDAVDYAENAFNVPVVAYSGEKDPQKAAADNIEKRLRDLKIPMTHLIAPGLGHQFPPEWQKKVEAEYAPHVAKGRYGNPARIRFVTYTLQYPRCGWVQIEGMERHYERARVDASVSGKGYTVRTENVRVLSLDQPEVSDELVPIQIDGQKVQVRLVLPSKEKLVETNLLILERHDGRWRPMSLEQIEADRKRRLQKRPGLQGPIDDAFAKDFLCVRGTGKPWHSFTQKYAAANLERFRFEWDKYLRGELPIKNDTDVTAEDIQEKSLILFGDPASNSLIGKVIDKLPLKWTRENIVFAGKTVTAGAHVPVLIYPNPLNTRRYVVLNSGHTFHAADFRGTNALLYPRLGDYALLKPAPTSKDPLAVDVITAGLFDDFWRIE